MTRVLGIIPARMASSRFPGKPLALIGSRTMLSLVFHASCSAAIDRRVVATCDEQISFNCRAAGFPCIMTSNTHVRALDRVAEAAEAMGAAGHDLVICIQGDEPMAECYEIDAFVADAERLTQSVSGRAVVMVRPVSSADRSDPNAVKAVIDQEGRMVYSTRAAVPADWRIAGIFAFRFAALKAFSLMQPTPLEIAESCDINRLIDNGVLPHVVRVRRSVPSVDVPSDVARVEAMLRDAA